MNIKIAQTTQNSWNFIVGKSSLIVYWRNGKVRRLSERFHTLIWRPGDTVQNLDSSGLSGRVDNTALSPNCPAVPSAYELFLIDSLLNLFSIIRRESFLTLSQTYLQRIDNFFCIFSLLAIDTHISHLLELCLPAFIEVRFLYIARHKINCIVR